jgi:hypothetical protein
MFIIELVTISMLWKQTRCPTTDEWIMRIWNIHTMEFYTAISEVRQVQKSKGHMFSLIHER